MKEKSSWYSSRLEQDMQLVRWGSYGRPVLTFPTAGGDAEEIERFQLIEALWPLIDAGRIKVYSVDSIAGQAWVSGERSPHDCSLLQNRFDSFVYFEVAPAIRTDCRTEDIEIITAGASIGAFNALATLCRHPDAFSTAICMSGTYDLSNWLGGGDWTDDFYFSSPLHYLPDLAEGTLLEQLRRCMVLLPTGQGKWEDPEQSWNIARVLGAKGIPNRVDTWGHEFDHDWPTWRQMLPHYLNELT
jgi:esterase/lipase superfamily enzyme